MMFESITSKITSMGMSNTDAFNVQRSILNQKVRM